jgi:hypothetical protein
MDSVVGFPSLGRIRTRFICYPSVFYGSRIVHILLRTLVDTGCFWYALILTNPFYFFSVGYGEAHLHLPQNGTIITRCLYISVCGIFSAIPLALHR